MTNKINDIDVSECSYYNKDNEPYCCEIWDNECEAQNCYFKQFKHLQEENKRLQMLSCANCGEKYLSPDGAELYEKNVRLQKENNILKQAIKNKNFVAIVEENEGLKSLNDFNVQKIEVLQEENEKLKENIKDLDAITSIFSVRLTNKYKQTLEEIRNIAETPIIADKNRFDEITNKINEVLNDRD